MRKPVFTGSGVAIVTPFTEDGVDFEKFGELIEKQIAAGTDALIVCGTTGEASTMPDDEHLSVIQYAVERVNKRIPVIAGTGSNDTKHAVHLTKSAQELGADGILSVTPYYNKTTQSGLYQHFKLVADCTNLPVILYNVPSRTNLNIDPNTIKALSDLENIVGIKECNINQVAEVIGLCGDDFTVYSGEDALVLPLMSLGGKGVISVMANIIPEDTHRMVVKFLNGDTEGSRKIQIAVTGLIKALFIEVNPIPIKAAMNLMGMNVGRCRLPLVDISPSSLEILRIALVKYGLLKQLI